MSSTLQPARSAPTLDAALFAVLVGVLAGLVSFHDWITDRSLESLAPGATLAALFCYVVVLRRSTLGAWSIGGVFLLLVLLFHFGDLVIIATGSSFSRTDQAYLNLWINSPAVPEAVYLSLLAVFGFAIAYATLGRSSQRVDDGATDDRDELFAVAGAILVVGGVAAYFLRAMTTAPGVLFSTNYDAYNSTLGGDRILSYANLAITLGLILAAAAPKCRARSVALGAFLVFAAVLLPLGVRTSTLFPAAAAVVAAARRHKMPNGWKALAVVILGLTLIAFVREVRTADPAHPLTLSSLNPASSLAEMGGTIRPVAETYTWGAVYHEERRHGLTYAAPLLRLKERLMGEPTPSPDDRLPGTLMQQRVVGGQFGYSAVAEAYLNFGRWGVPVVFALFGAFAGVVDGRPRASVASAAAAAAGVVMAGLGLTVRNSFVSMPSMLIAGFAVLLAVQILSRGTADRRLAREIRAARR